MRVGIILQSNDPEKAFNGVRFCNAAVSSGHLVKLFLMSAGVEVEQITEEPYNVREQLYRFVEQGGEVLACGTCMKGRKQVPTQACPVSTMNDCVQMVDWADKVVTF